MAAVEDATSPPTEVNRMNSRERVLAVLARKPVDRLPVDIWHTDEIQQMLQEYYGAENDLDLYRKMGVDKIVWLFPVYTPPGRDGPVGSTHFGKAERSMWGTPLKEQQAGDALYQEFGEAPLRAYETIDSLDDYPYWPDPRCFDYDAMIDTVRQARADFVTLGPWVSFYEVYCQMRGLEQAMMDLIMRPEYVQAALDRIEHCQTEMMKRFFDKALGLVDLGFVSDDMGSQNGLLLSLEMWDTFFKARLRRWCDLIHGYGIRVFYHTDGAAEPLIPRLIDCGIDVLNPIQHACPGMDRAELKRKYGDRLIFHGGIENQRVLPFGTADDVRAEVRECMRTLGAGREGYIVCSCHNIQPGTPLDNALAMVETVQREGTLD
jgi:uroporphyrinogen decarboxylase